MSDVCDVYFRLIDNFDNFCYAIKQRWQRWSLLLLYTTQNWHTAALLIVQCISMHSLTFSSARSLNGRLINFDNRMPAVWERGRGEEMNRLARIEYRVKCM